MDFSLLINPDNGTRGQAEKQFEQVSRSQNPRFGARSPTALTRPLTDEATTGCVSVGHDAVFDHLAAS